MKQRTKWLLILAGGCWMLGEGARMVIMGLFFQEWSYQPNLFDLLFDWAPMLVIGSILLLDSIHSFYSARTEEYNKRVLPEITSENISKRNRSRATRLPK